MKVTQDEDGFQKINLTLETREEAEILWHLLNGTTEKAKSIKGEVAVVDMWKYLDDVFGRKDFEDQ